MKKLSGFHDSEIIGLNIDFNDLEIRFAKSVFQKIILKDTIIIKVQDFLLQNVVSVAWLVDSESNKIEIDELVKWMSKMDDHTELYDEDAISKHVQNVISGSSIIVYLEPSWGLSIAVLCRSFTTITLASARPDHQLSI